MFQRRPVSEVFGDIVANLEGIVRAEFRLARAELGEQLHSVRPAATLIAVGVVAGSLSVLFLLFAVADALSLVMPAWLATLIVGIALAVGGALAVTIGARRLRRQASSPMPRTVASLKENVEWIRPRSK